MPKYHRRKPKNNKKHMKVSRRTYIPKRIRYVDEFHTKLSMDSNGAQAYDLDTPSFGGFNSIAIPFLLKNCLNIGSWEKLFEEVRVNKVHIRFTPSTTAIVANEEGNPQVLPRQVSSNIPMVYYLIDRNDSVAEPTADDFKEYSKTVMKGANRKHEITFTPSVLSPIYAGLDLNNNPIYTYSVDYDKKWLQLSNATAKETIFYGVKYGIEGSDCRQFTMSVDVDMYVSFRGKRE